eukprot:TRINITY_DN1487_c0_g1_i1.p1 TRINITY_DN1487_c0_g1~~TRINITY_DN1487_c0_g1_i1.p1  ORF type:complete len:262 (+),score=47.65 TRINITY_DN1487_c0_g1_i1:111-896(+)
MENKACHFVLVHGATLGAWSWYRLSHLLINAGHSVTALDMAAQGINLTPLEQVKTLEDYSAPLLQFLQNLEENDMKVILVGHSLGGFNISLAMEMFPHKISAAVFVTAFMPCNSQSFPQMMQLVDSDLGGDWQDTTFELEEGEEGQPIFERVKSFQFGRSLVLNRLCQKCPSQDLLLAESLFRKCPYIKEKMELTTEKYGSVKRAYVVCKEDKILFPELQMKIIKDNPPHQVHYIEEADHCPVFSCPDRLALILDEISATI